MAGKYPELAQLGTLAQPDPPSYQDNQTHQAHHPNQINKTHKAFQTQPTN